LAAAPEARFVVTSRELLRLPLERVFEVAPLSVVRSSPTNPSDAAMLFVDRARSARHNFQPTEADWLSIERIVSSLDGLALAVELAAARVSVLSVQEIERLLPQRFDLLTNGYRGAPERQQALLSTLDWSWRLLSPDEQRAFLQLSTFRGGFSLEAAAATLRIGSIPATDAVESLRGKSMLRRLEPSTHEQLPETRFGFYESVRAYAAVKLAENRDVDFETRERHARHFADRSSRWSIEALKREGSRALDRLSRESENLSAAFEWALGAARENPELTAVAFDLLDGLDTLANLSGPIEAQLRRIDRAIEFAAVHAVAPLHHVKALQSRARLYRIMGLVEKSEADLALALEIVERGTDGNDVCSGIE
jgi:predicted ATPase